MESTRRINVLLNALRQKTGHIHLDLKSAVQYLCDCYHGAVGNETITEHNANEPFETVNTLKTLLNDANRKTGKNHADVTSAMQTLCNGYSAQTPMYSFGLVSDIHLQYVTGIADFQRALAYFDKQNIPFTCVCGDLTQAGTMVNAEQYTSDWKGGLDDYKDIVGNRDDVYAIGGNHEGYTSTYDATTNKWNAVDLGLDMDYWKEKTGLDPFYTVSSNPTNATTHNVHNATIPSTDVFIMLSSKKAKAPNFFFTADDGEDEFAWLQNTLETNKNKRCYVLFHYHDNLDKTADPFAVYPHGVSEDTEQGKAFIDLMRQYPNVIWFHGHTHNTFEADRYSVATATHRGYKSVNVPSLQGPRKFAEDGSFAVLISEGYIVDVYENCIVLKALDFSTVNQDGTGRATEMESYVLDTL